MAAPAIDAILAQEAGRIGEDLFYNSLHTSPWIDLVEYADWPEEMGSSISVLSYNRSLPANPLTWADLTVSSGQAGGIGLPPKQAIAVSQKLREYNLQHTALESPDICVNDLRNTFKATEQLNAVRKILVENTRQVWIDRNRSEFVRNAKHKIIAKDTGITVQDDEWLVQMPDTVATGGLLKRVYASMVRQGAGQNSSGMVSGRPSFVAICGMETSERLFTDVASGQRDDVRYSNRVPELLAPLGAERLFKGFWLVDDVFPPRHNLDGGEWVEVQPYEIVDGELVDNLDYEDTDTEDIIFYHTDVFRSLIPKPAHNYGNATFDPVKYRGEWAWLNIQHLTENPDKNWGRFRGVFSQGSKPVFPEFGYVLRVLRCNIPVEGTACAS